MFNNQQKKVTDKKNLKKILHNYEERKTEPHKNQQIGTT